MQIACTTEIHSSEKTLVRHPPCDGIAVCDLTVRVAVDKRELRLSYRLQADLEKLRIPPPRPGVRTDGLWQHSCFEVFIRGDAGSAYLEYNFSPSGEWAAYQFLDYRRDPAPIDTASSPVIRVNQTPGQLELEAMVSISDLRALQGQLQLGLAAVVEACDCSLSYWALNHPAEKPDFHHPDSFALLLPMDDVP